MKQSNYQLLDCGDERRLELFGEILVDRPAPQARFPKALSSEVWEQAHARFIRNKTETRWDFKDQPLESFHFIYGKMQMDLRFSPNGQLGVYPEQQENWDWLQQLIKREEQPLRILNGFAYTGGSTLAAASAFTEKIDHEICHLDSSKSSVNWARENAQHMGLQQQTIRYMVEDILKYMEREVKRSNSYQGMILDPPAFGRAKGGKTWKIQRDLPRLISLCAALFRESPRFFLLSCHDREISKEMLKDYLSQIPEIQRNKIELLDLTIPSSEGNPLPNGIAARWSRF